MLFTIKKAEWTGNIRDDIFGGLVTSVALIPEVIGFAIIAGVHPITALFASVTTGLVTSFLGGRPAMVSAAAGSMALVMVTLIKTHGIEYMVAATLLTGILQVLLGYLGIHKLMRFISQPVMHGFVNALAILIFTAQVQQLAGRNIATYLMVGAAILMMYLLPKVSKMIPPALIVIVSMTLVSLLPGLGLQTVGDLGDMSGTLPLPGLPAIPLNLDTLRIIFPTSLALAMVGLMESLLTLPLVNELTGSRGDEEREVKAQGLANIVTGFFGGPAGCAMIGQAVINVKSGGKKRLSTLVASLTLLFLIVALKQVMIAIPTAALIGIMITVAGETFDWNSVKTIKTIPLTEAIVMVTTVAIVVYTHNLAIGILAGVLLSMVFFIATASRLEFRHEGDTLFVSGQLFFASIQSLAAFFDTLAPQTHLTLDLTHVQIRDHSTAETLHRLVTGLEQQEITCRLVGVRTDHAALLELCE